MVLMLQGQVVTRQDRSETVFLKDLPPRREKGANVRGQERSR